MKIILIMGLPGAGKTTLANELEKLIKSKRLNADEIRKAANDWDFSEEGRKRQAKRMSEADYTVWVDTIKKGRFDDTNQMFVKPEKFDFHVTTQDAKLWAPKIAEDLK